MPNGRHSRSDPRTPWSPTRAAVRFSTTGAGSRATTYARLPATWSSLSDRCGSTGPAGEVRSRAGRVIRREDPLLPHPPGLLRSVERPLLPLLELPGGAGSSGSGRIVARTPGRESHINLRRPQPAARLALPAPSPRQNPLLRSGGPGRNGLENGIVRSAGTDPKKVGPGPATSRVDGVILREGTPGARRGGPSNTRRGRGPRSFRRPEPLALSLRGGAFGPPRLVVTPLDREGSPAYPTALAAPAREEAAPFALKNGEASPFPLDVLRHRRPRYRANRERKSWRWSRARPRGPGKSPQEADGELFSRSGAREPPAHGPPREEQPPPRFGPTDSARDDGLRWRQATRA